MKHASVFRTRDLKSAKLTKAILPELGGDASVSTHDSSTNGLINAFTPMRA